MANVKEMPEDFQIQPVRMEFHEEAKALVLNGLEERFGFLDLSYNPDLQSILQSYGGERSVFLVGIHDGLVICTGAVSFDAPGVGRVERMSVMKSYRRAGAAKAMIRSLESWARQEGYRRLVLETNNEWQSAIELYKKTGYTLYENDGKFSHFKKDLAQ